MKKMAIRGLVGLFALLAFACIVSVIAGSGQRPVFRIAQGDMVFQIVELPMPNSGTFSFKQAEARKHEILSNIPSPKLKCPDVACCIHIEKDDTITVYNHALNGLPEYSQPRMKQTVAEMVETIHAVPVCNAPYTVMITSDVPLKRSKTIHDVLKVLFVPGVQLLYVADSSRR